jgi:hypothetical protein
MALFHGKPRNIGLNANGPPLTVSRRYSCARRTNDGVIDMPKRTSSGAARPPSAASEPGARTEDLGDEFLAAILIRMWALASGRTLRRDVSPDQLSPEELIAFWADDMNTSPGRHARPGGSGRIADSQVTTIAARSVPPRRGRCPRRSSPGGGGTCRNRQERPADPAASCCYPFSASPDGLVLRIWPPTAPCGSAQGSRLAAISPH